MEPAPRLVLTDDHGNPVRRDVALVGDAVTIGRSAANAVVLDDEQVSKNHAVLRRQGSRWLLQDLKSSNGTFVNGERVDRHLLEGGDVVELGASRFVFETGAKKPQLAVRLVSAERSDAANVLATRAVQAFAPGAALRDTSQLRGGYERLRVAFEAVQSLMASTDVAAVAHHLFDVVFELVRPESGVLFLVDGAGELKHVASRGMYADATVSVSRTIVERAFSERQAILATDALYDERFAAAPSVVRTGLRSVMCMPLVTKDQTLGVLHVGSASRASAFTQEDLELLLGVGAGASVAVANVLLRRRLDDEARTRDSLGRFLSPVLLEQVMQKKVQLTRGGREAQVTVLFADIRGFTSLSEQRPPAEIVALLNEYFEQMVEVVFRHQGVLDKFIGDALMAVWGTPVSQGEDATRALSAAREMQAALASLNEYRESRGEEPIRIGIGLASGQCVAGTIGARRRMEYTVIGDCVNLASRLCGLAEAGQIIIDEETFRRAEGPTGAQKLAPQKVKGKTKPVAVYSVR